MSDSSQSKDQSAQNEPAFTAVMLAAFNGEADALIKLLNAGENPNAQTEKGTTPLLLAIRGGQLECARILLERGASPSLATSEGYQPLHEAVAQGNAVATRLVLGAGVDPNPLDSQGRAPLHEAARLGHTQIVSALLEAGAEPELRSLDDLSWTAWCFAKQGGHGAVLLELARNGVKPCLESKPPARHRKGGIGLLFRKFLAARSDRRVIEGMVVRVLPKRHRERTYERVREALQVLQTHDPRRWVQVQRYLTSIWIPGWHFVYGAYDADLHACVLASPYVLSPDTSSAAIAGTIVHEATHARLWKEEYETNAFVRARTERLCYQAQRDFLSKIPEAVELSRLIDEQRSADPMAWSSAVLARARRAMLKQEKVPMWLTRLLPE